MGPVTMLRGLRRVVSRNCPKLTLEAKRNQLKWACGSEHFVLYQEMEIDCFGTSDECPPERERSGFFGARFGIFMPGAGRHLVAWPRFEDCEDWGCSGGGWDESSAKLPDNN